MNIGAKCVKCGDDNWGNMERGPVCRTCVPSKRAIPGEWPRVIQVAKAYHKKTKRTHYRLIISWEGLKFYRAGIVWVGKSKIQIQMLSRDEFQSKEAAVRHVKRCLRLGTIRRSIELETK